MNFRFLAVIVLLDLLCRSAVGEETVSVKNAVKSGATSMTREERIKAHFARVQKIREETAARDLALGDDKKVKIHVEDNEGKPIDVAAVSITWLPEVKDIVTSSGVKNPARHRPRETRRSTDSFGNSNFPLEGGAGWITVHAKNYVQLLLPLQNIAAGTLPLKITAKGGATIRGKVIDAQTSSPASRVKVWVEPVTAFDYPKGYSSNAPLTRFGFREEAVTDADGIFQVSFLPEGKVRVTVDSGELNSIDNIPGRIIIEVKAGDNKVIPDVVKQSPKS